MLDYEIIEYRVYYNKNRCFKRVFTEDAAIKEYKELKQKHDDVRIKKISKAIIDFK